MVYLNSAFISIINMFAAFIITGVFSRYLNESDFVDYLLVHRYLGLYVALCGGGYGYAISKYVKNNGSKSILTYGAAIAIAPFFLLLPIFYTYVANDSIFIFTWVLSQSLFHIMSSYYRSIGKIVFADVLSLLTKGMLFIFIAMVCSIFGMDYEWYFLLTGLIVLIVLLSLFSKINEIETTGKFISLSNFIYFGLSRYIENLVRLAYPVALVYLSVGMLGEKEGAYISIVFILLKASESLLQPILMNFYNKKVNFVSNINVFIGISLLSITAPFIVDNIGEFLLLLWLGDGYSFLNEYLYLVSFIVFPILYNAIFKVSIESSFKISPVMYVNILSFFPLCLFYFDMFEHELNVEFLIYIVIATYWARFLILYGLYFVPKRAEYD